MQFEFCLPFHVICTAIDSAFAVDDLPILISSSNPSVKTYTVQPSIQHTPNVRTPRFALSSRPNSNKKRKLAHPSYSASAKDDELAAADALEDWEANMGEVFEWVGMAGLGAQRFVFLDISSL